MGESYRGENVRVVKCCVFGLGMVTHVLVLFVVVTHAVRGASGVLIGDKSLMACEA